MVLADHLLEALGPHPVGKWAIGPGGRREESAISPSGGGFSASHSREAITKAAAVDRGLLHERAISF
jgi:hypothetical protein